MWAASVPSASSLVCLHLQLLALLTRMAAGKQPWTPPTPEVSAVVHGVAVKHITHGVAVKHITHIALTWLQWSLWTPGGLRRAFMNQVRLSSWLPFLPPQPGHCAGKAEPNEPIQAKKKKVVEAVRPVILGLRLLEDFFIYFSVTDAVQEMRSCNCRVEICFFLNYRLQCERAGTSSQGTWACITGRSW